MRGAEGIVFAFGTAGETRQASALAQHADAVAAVAVQDGLVVVEGFFAVFALAQAGIYAVALMGSTLSPEQEELLLVAVGGAQGRVALMLDRDEAGRAATKELHARLITKTHVRVVPYDGRQPDDLSPTQLRALLMDA